MLVYWGSFVVACVICVVIQVVSNNGNSKSTSLSANPKFSSFQKTYLAVFLLAMFSDWLQGPYVYELYVSYGFSNTEIAELFVCGFGSSMIVGTFVGGFADKIGRKFMCLLYCILYILACITKTFPQYWILMLGRFLSGIATSLLFSVFESWMVCEHHKQGFESSLLGDTFSYATFGNGVVAVVAGLSANFAAQSYGYVAPFIVAIVPLVLVGVIISFSWTENYGNQTMSHFASLIKGFELIRSDTRIAALGLAQSSFEGAMYTFVFMWTPALKAGETENEENETSSYLGLIFAVFMICVMIGSSIFKIFSVSKENLYKIPLFVHGIACAAMLITSLAVGKLPFVVYLMFLVFETTVGMFYPAYGVIKSEKIPEDIRSSVMNIFRMPLNFFVVLLLLKIKYLSEEKVFLICAGAHALSYFCYLYFYHYSKEYLPHYRSVASTDIEMNGK